MPLPVSGWSNWRRTSEYRTAIASAVRAAAPEAAPTDTRPRMSVPSMVKNLAPTDSIGEEYVPFSSTAPKRSSSASRGTRTPENQMRPLSTPSRPPLWPWSVVLTPGRSLPCSSRIGTSRQCTP